MSRIQELMPRYRLREIDRVAVAVQPSLAFMALCETDLRRVAGARWLFASSAPGTWFQLLSEDDREIVAGSVGRLWQPGGERAPVSAQTFAELALPGAAKLACSVRVAPRLQGGSWVTFDLRADAFGDDAWQRFSRHWGSIGRLSRLLRRAWLRQVRGMLGVAPSERSQPLAGDDILPRARKQLTHAVFIEAPPAQVWPWLVQMGCRRAGWYSWDQLDNGGVPSADHVVPELQRISVGDILPVKPEGEEGFAVLRVEPQRALVLGSPSLLPGGKNWGVPGEATWSFALEPVGDDATQLVVRVRVAYEPSVPMAAFGAVIPLVHDFMERKQLRTLKQHVET